MYRELHPPTGVEHCLECNFFNSQRTSLVVASTSLLRVYDLSEVMPMVRSIWSFNCSYSIACS